MLFKLLGHPRLKNGVELAQLLLGLLQARPVGLLVLLGEQVFLARFVHGLFQIVVLIAQTLNFLPQFAHFGRADILHNAGG